MTEDEWIDQAADIYREHGYGEPGVAARAMFDEICEILEDDDAALALDPKIEARRFIDLDVQEARNPSTDLDDPGGPEFA